MSMHYLVINMDFLSCEPAFLRAAAVLTPPLFYGILSGR